jgi:uncharacterized tellurite resistance protein B-like protein
MEVKISMALSISHIIREAKKIVKRKIPGFKETLSVKELRQNPFICVMIQCAYKDGEVNDDEKFLIRKVVRAAYSFVDGEEIDKILPKAIEEEAKNPTPIGDIVINLKDRTPKTPYDAEYEDKLHLITFAYMLSMEDYEINEKEEEYIKELAQKLKVSNVDMESIKRTVVNEFSAQGSKRAGNLYRNVAKFSLINIDELYKDPIFNLLVQIASAQGSFISQEEREMIKTILCSIHDISRITINNVFNKAVEKVIEDPINMEKLINELKDTNVDIEPLIKLAYFIILKRDEEGKQSEMEIVENIHKLLNVPDDKIKNIINEVKSIIEKQRTLDYMKGRDVFNAVNGMHVGVIIDENKENNEWVIKEPSGVVYEMDKSKVFIREIN